MGQYKDFDAFFAEQNQDPIATFTLYGVIHELPTSLPAAVLLKMQRMHKQYGNKGIPEFEQFEIAYLVFGEKNVEKWCKKEMTVDQLAELIKWAYGHYTPQEKATNKTVKKK